MRPFKMKKWYFDVIAESGEVLYAYFIDSRLFGRTRSLVSAHLTLPDGSVVRSSVTAEAERARPGGGLRIGRSVLGDPDGAPRLHLELGEVAADLGYAGLEEAWTPAPQGILLDGGAGVLTWRVPLPAAKVEGEVRAGGRRIAVVGLGYHDFVETDISPWRLPIKELLWGRVHGDGSTVVFNQVRLRDGRVFQNLFAGGRAADDQGFVIRTDDEDATTRISKAGWVLTLKRRRIIEESPVTTADRLPSPLLRSALGRICGDPREKKMLSDAIAGAGDDIRRGLAFHERVVWKW